MTEWSKAVVLWEIVKYSGVTYMKCTDGISRETLKLHERLTEVHFNLGYASRMRNHLAEDMLSTNMLNLIKVNNTLCVKAHTDWTQFPNGNKTIEKNIKESN